MRRLQNSSFSVGQIDSVLGDMGYGGFARHYATLGSGLASLTGVQSGYELSQGQDLWRGNSLTTGEKLWNTVDVGLSAAGAASSSGPMIASCTLATRQCHPADRS
jgi:hypothetical protein